MKKRKKTKVRNFVAKHAQSCGAGQHVDKLGERAPRNRQKKRWKKEIARDLASD